MNSVALDDYGRLDVKDEFSSSSPSAACGGRGGRSPSSS